MEYRRFIAYFYEYINGKKQKNAGFAKVELRNGVWRILLRLTTEPRPLPPIQVYGFVREKSGLPGFAIGTIRPVQEVVEEWAFRADAPIGKGRYRLEDFAGIWIESADGRCFITVWDDEGIDTERFAPEPLVTEEKGAEEHSVPEEEKEAVPEEEQAGREMKNAGAEQAVPEEEHSGREMKGAGAEEKQAVPEEEYSGPEMKNTGAEEPEGGSPLPESAETQETAIQEDEAQEAEAEETGTQKAEVQETEIAEETEAQKIEAQEASDTCLAEELLRKRTHFQPFTDTEIVECVMIRPCDIVRLQQENWKVGQSSFLQHAFYQHRHLLLGKTGKGTFLLGVPGIRNPHETYMARLFGFDDFKMCGRQNTGQEFGYWCRKLEQGAA